MPFRLTFVFDDVCASIGERKCVRSGAAEWPRSGGPSRANARRSVQKLC